MSYFQPVQVRVADLDEDVQLDGLAYPPPDSRYQPVRDLVYSLDRRQLQR